MKLDFEDVRKYGEEHGEDAIYENLWRCAGSDEYYDSEDDGEWVDDEWYSTDWLEDNAIQCEDCGCWILDRSDTIYVENVGEICNSCYNNGCYFYCDDCGCYYYENNINYCEDDGNYYCDDCIDSHQKNSRIMSYHEFDGNWKQYTTGNEKNKNNYFIGFELEVVPKNGSRYNEAEALDNLESKLNVIFEEDGSLDDGGFEIISHPQTFEYIKAKKENYKRAFDRMIDLDYISHNAGCCGLHFHFTRPKNDTEFLRRAWLIFETYKNEIQKLSRRDGDAHWCHWLSENTSKKIDALCSDYIDTHKDGDRYKAINNTNDNTIEFRLFRGTLNYNTFMSDLEFLNNVYKYANSKIDLCKITWQKLTKGEFITNYVNEHNIKSDKIIKDYRLTKASFENKKYILSNNIFEIVTKEIKNDVKNTFEKIDDIFDTDYVTLDAYDKMRSGVKLVGDLKYCLHYNYFKDFRRYIEGGFFNNQITQNTEKINKLLKKINKIENEEEALLCV